MADESRLGDIESRLLGIERRLGLVPVPEPAESGETAKSTADDPRASSESPAIPTGSAGASDETATLSGKKLAELADTKRRSSAGIFLGFVGVACFILAAVTLIRLSIDSGWLTPGRQLMMAFSFGLALIGVGFLRWFKDSIYMTLLPGAGVVTLHLTIYGGVFYHGLISAPVAFGMVSAVSLLAMWLVARLATDFFAVATVVGTYLGAILLGSKLEDLVLVGVFLVVWDLVYATFSITLKNRRLLTLAAFFALLMVAFEGIRLDANEELRSLAILQFIQFLIFVGGVVRYTTVHRTPLTRTEAGALGPILLFFYGTEYSFLHRLNPDMAPWRGIGFAAAIFAIYAYARHRIKEGELASREMAMTTVSVVLFHCVFLVLLGDDGRAVAGLIMLLAAGFLLKGLALRDCGPHLAICLLLPIAWAYFSTLTGIGIELGFSTIIGGLFGVILLLGARFYLGTGADSGERVPRWGPILLAAHLQVLVFLHRVPQLFVDEVEGLLVSILWVLYALAILGWGWARRDKELGQSALGVITLATIKVLLLDLDQASGIGRVGGLIVLGAVIFSCGYLYRKICAWETT